MPWIMKKRILILVFAFLAFSLPFISKGQDAASVIEQELNMHDLKSNILPLNQLLDSAEIHSPLLKMIDADIYIQDLKVKSEKKDWLSYFSLTGTAKYGMFDNLVINEEVGEDYLGSTNTKQSRYSVGLAIKVPFSSVFDKVNRNVALSEKEKLRHQRENTIIELRKLVITQYGNLLRAHSKLIIRTSEMETVKLQMADTELNYKNGKIPLTEFTKQKSELLDLQLQHEEVRIEFTVALHLLQETIGIDLNLNPTM